MTSDKTLQEKYDIAVAALRLIVDGPMGDESCHGRARAGEAEKALRNIGEKP